MDDQIISYRLVFKETNGILSGYSVTNLSGEHETKNLIEGTYSYITKKFTFKETNIVYTKSPLTKEAFCYVNFSGEVKLNNENSKLDGDFQGFFDNKEKCIDGTMILIGSANIYKKLGKIDKKIQKTKKITKAEKEMINPYALMDSLQISTLKKNENLNVFWKSPKFVLELYDEGKIDGDKVRIIHNKKIILDNYQLLKQRKRIEVELKEGQNVFEIIALNEGEIQPNTAVLELIDGEQNIKLFGNLKKGESNSITIIKQ
uniref:hypothetical protein n=1 Tax=Flavobacterium sp. TaxID=239 RepID=UPI00404AE824